MAHRFDLNICQDCGITSQEAMKSTEALKCPGKADDAARVVAAPVTPAPSPRPKEGRIVHYVMGHGPHKGEHRPAIVVKVWGPECVNLQVFTDGENDCDPCADPNAPGAERAHAIVQQQQGVSGLFWGTSVMLDASGQTPQSWHWPERE